MRKPDTSTAMASFCRLKPTSEEVQGNYETPLLWTLHFSMTIFHVGKRGYREAQPENSLVGLLIFELDWPNSRIQEFAEEPGVAHWRSVGRVLRLVSVAKELWQRYRGASISLEWVIEADEPEGVDTAKQLVSLAFVEDRLPS